MPHPSVSDSWLVLCPGITQAIKIEAGTRTPACSWWRKLKLSLHIKILAREIFDGALSWIPEDEVLKLVYSFFLPWTDTNASGHSLGICTGCACYSPLPQAHTCPQGHIAKNTQPWNPPNEGSPCHRLAWLEGLSPLHGAQWRLACSPSGIRVPYKAGHPGPKKELSALPEKVRVLIALCFLSLRKWGLSQGLAKLSAALIVMNGSKRGFLHSPSQPCLLRWTRDSAGWVGHREMNHHASLSQGLNELHFASRWVNLYSWTETE